MVKLAEYNMTEVQDFNEKFAVLPAGDYHVCITEDTLNYKKDGGEPYLTFRYDVLTGPYRGRVVFDNLYLWSEKERSGQSTFFQSKLKGIAKAVGYSNPDWIQDSSELVGGEMIVTLRVQKETENYPEKNDIRAYKKVPAAPVAGMPPQTAAPRPPASQPQPVATASAQPTPPPAQPAPAGPPPWEKPQASPAPEQKNALDDVSF